MVFQLHYSQGSQTRKSFAELIFDSEKNNARCKSEAVGFKDYRFGIIRLGRS